MWTKYLFNVFSYFKNKEDYADWCSRHFCQICSKKEFLSMFNWSCFTHGNSIKYVLAWCLKFVALHLILKNNLGRNLKVIRDKYTIQYNCESNTCINITEYKSLIKVSDLKCLKLQSLRHSLYCEFYIPIEVESIFRRWRVENHINSMICWPIYKKQ